MFTDDASSSERPITENIFSGETVFLYFDSNIPETRQHEIRKQLRFQGASISQFGQESPGKKLKEGNKIK